MNEREKLLAELGEAEHNYNAFRRDCRWDEAQAAAELVMNLARRLYLLELQQKLLRLP